MIAVGIPTYNEADNIGSLVAQLDSFAAKLGLSIVIINADNSSPDGTSAAFNNQPTVCQKVGLVTKRRGKGINIWAILEYVAQHGDIDYCLFVDGDITSCEKTWLTSHVEQASGGADYVVPNYARSMYEGNTTNHFAYPLLSALTGGKAPRQPIAGDFGLSRHFMEYLKRQELPAAAEQYGIDIFLTMQALLGGMDVREIALGRKLHKPSFDKMVPMFEQVACSYYSTRTSLPDPVDLRTTVKFTSSCNSDAVLLKGAPISADRIAARRAEALELLKALRSDGIQIFDVAADDTAMAAERWVAVLVAHEAARREYDPAVIARSLTPFYLLRVTDYLEGVADPVAAAAVIEEQAMQLGAALKTR